MTTLQKIIKDAKSLRAKSPKKYSKWTDYVKEASKKYASKTKTVKKKKAAKKTVKRSNTLTKVKKVLKQDKKRLKHGYSLTSGNVRIGACNQMSLKHYEDICNRINRVEENIIDLRNNIKDKTKSLGFRISSKKALIEDKKYLRELKTQKTEIKKLL